MERQRSKLEQSIVATLAYFDIFSYPLKVEEIWRWLYVVGDDNGAEIETATPADVERTVRLLETGGRVERVGSFVVLTGRSVNVATRIQRKVVSDRMWRRARFASSVLRVVPFVRFVGVVNSLAIDNVKPESDIDLFIVVQRGRMWLTRFFVTTLTYLLGIRRHGKKVANRVCLSFFLSDRVLSLETMKFESNDPYLAFWTGSVVPMFDRSGTWSQFTKANDWILSRLPNGLSVIPAAYHADAWLPGLLRSTGEMLMTTWLGDALELMARFGQTIKMKFPSITAADRGESGVVVSPDILKFHERDRRREYREAFLARLSEVA